MEKEKIRLRDSIAKSIDQCAIIRVNLLDLESSINQPQFKTLMNNNWEVISSFAIEDKNIPYLILILKPPNYTEQSIGNDINYYYVIPICFIAIFNLIQIIIYLMR